MHDILTEYPSKFHQGVSAVPDPKSVEFSSRNGGGVTEYYRLGVRTIWQGLLGAPIGGRGNV